jgi:hypothetical protein
VRARLLGYVAAAESVTVTNGSTTTANFTLQKAATSLEAVAITGTRGEERTVISAAVPIDVLSTTDIQLTGRTETSQIIQAVAPSFNFPRTSDWRRDRSHSPATSRQARIRRSCSSTASAGTRRARQREWIRRTRIAGGGLERDPREHDRSHRDFARRRRGAVWV